MKYLDEYVIATKYKTGANQSGNEKVVLQDNKDTRVN